MYEEIIKFIRKIYNTSDIIPLHTPRFIGNEKKYLNACIDSTFVSYVGEFVTQFEDMIKEYAGAKYAVATANGTLALHTALITLGIQENDEVLTQALTFVATANAISHSGAKPVFIDCERETLGMSPEKLEEFLQRNTIFHDDGLCYNKRTGRKIAACIPVHVFGHPVRIDDIGDICSKYHIVCIEDAAESLGSLYKGQHTGTFGKVGIFSFNGNKIVTAGGGGVVVTNDESIATLAKHITTTAKVVHKWEIYHDRIGYNYRLPNVNAAIGCAQMESLPKFLENKRELAGFYKEFFDEMSIYFYTEREDCFSNYWLNAILLQDRTKRDSFLEYSAINGVMTRPVWKLLNTLPMYENCQTTDLEDANFLADRIVNLPSSVRL
jgi:perosamine synthetase